MKKKIMFMIPTLGGGGAEKILVDIINNIDRNLFDITLILLKKTGINLSKLNDDVNVKYIVKSDNYFFDKVQKMLIKYIPKIYYSFYIRDKYDVEVAFLEGLATNMVANSSNNNSKKIAWVHCDMSKYNWTKKYFKLGKQRKEYDKFDNIVFVSNKCKEGFENQFKNNLVQKQVIYNPIINDDIIKKSLEKYISYKEFTIVAIGSLSKVKGFDRLVKAFHKLHKSNNIKLVIIGEGPERSNLEDLINKYDLNGKVELLGFKNNPYPYIKAANLIVSSSHSEAYPTVILESVVLGKAILATNVDGNNEALGYGAYGILCNSSVNAIYKSIESIISNIDIIEEYENKSKKLAKELNYKKQIKKIEHILK